MKSFVMVAWLGLILLGASAPVLADVLQSRPVSFKPGQTQTTISGVLQGRQSIDYRVHAQAGQTLTVRFKPTNRSAYFNVLPPGSAGEAIFIGSTSGDEWSGPLTADGDYTIRTYLMRSAARRNEVSRFTLTVSLGTGTLGTASASDAKVAGTSYHATGHVPCATGSDAAGAADCAFGVIRGAPGNAEVHITTPGKRQRVLTFLGDKVTTNGSLKVSRVADQWSVEVNDQERYTIPGAVINGG